MEAIEVKKLVKQYKKGVRALDGLTLNVNQGEIFSLLGPNGAGKTTLINILTTYISPTSGTVTMLGKDLSREAGSIRMNIACVAQRISIDTHLSLVENLVFQSRLYRVDHTIAKARITHLIDSFGLGRFVKYPVASYSGGIKRRMDIAINMVANPQILFLDEPTIGMDIGSRKMMWEMMRTIRDEYKTTIFLTTHYLEEAEQLSDSICIMKDGHELVQGTPANLRQYICQNMLRIGFNDPETAKDWAQTLTENHLLPAANIRDGSIYGDAGDNRDIFKSVNQWLLENDVPFGAIELVQPSLEDVFLKITGIERR